MKILPIEYSVRNLLRAPLRTVLSIAAATFVILLILAATGFVRGMQASLVASGRLNNVILLGAGSEESLERSELGMQVPSMVEASLPVIRRYGGVACISPEIQLMLPVGRMSGEKRPESMQFRGVTETAWLVHDGMSMVAGRVPHPGADELLLGRRAAHRLGIPDDAKSVGSTLWLDRHPFIVSGIFTAPGTVMDAEIWCPLIPLQIAAKRDSLSCVVLTLSLPGQFDEVDMFAKQRLDLELIAVREQDYYAGLNTFYAPIRGLVWVTAVLIALSGLLGGLTTMYAAVSARARELGALQAIGFGQRAIVLALGLESVLIAVCGSLLAIVLGELLLNGVSVPFSMGSFGLQLDGGVKLVGLVAGLLLGMIGVIPPAWHSLRRPLPELLK